MNSIKILNDPVYGFINIPSSLILGLIDHPWFQRLRRIKQIGLTDLVYPGANHTRFHHALGAMHLMSVTLDNLRIKGVEISDEEYQAALIAILLHDIGHGPFSHTLEFSLLQEVSHEDISLTVMERLNREFDNQFPLSLSIFKGSYHRKFLNKLVASQLDIDRLDYLQRDSYYTGVSEGTIGAQRIIKLLNVVNDDLVVEEKGIYSIENFLNARKLMYWQVYLHKTTISAEKMLNALLSRARDLARNGTRLEASPPLLTFLNEQVDAGMMKQDKYLHAFVDLDDTDIIAAVKAWRSHEDRVLSYLASAIMSRALFKVKFSSEKTSKNEIEAIRGKIMAKSDFTEKDADYLISTGKISNAAYFSKGKKIKLLTRSGEVIDIKETSDLPNISAMSKIIKKHYLSFPKFVNS